MTDDIDRQGWEYNSPPNWPAPPPGWRPPEGWTPDRDWGPAPDDWTFWTPIESLSGEPSSAMETAANQGSDHSPSRFRKGYAEDEWAGATWEYKVFRLAEPMGSKTERKLNNLGRVGWELVSTSQNASGAIEYNLKRRVQ
jgi:hypothetical protein